MSNVKLAYSATNTAMTITLANLSNVAARESTAVDNSSNLYLDAMVRLQVGVGTTTGTDQAVYVYAYGSENGATYPSPVTGSDAAVLTTPTNLPLLQVINCAGYPFTSTNLNVTIPSVAQAFGGVLPLKWGIVVDNRCGGSLVNTAANHYCTYTGIFQTVI